MNKLTKQRREVKSPFTKEERTGVFMTIEESRKRRTNKLTKQRRTLRTKQPENKIETEQEFKEDLKYRMYQDSLHPYCDCEICQEAHKKFEDTPDVFLEERWRDYLEQVNREPSTDEEIDTVFAKYGLVLDRETGEVSSL